VLKEFKEFALKGNVMDMAVGIVIGAAFSKIVSSLVNDLITPVMGFLTAGVDFTSLKIMLPSNGQDPAAAIMYGNFIQAALDFIIIAFSIFIAIKLINKFRRKQEQAKEESPAMPQTSATEKELLTEIRDILKGKAAGN